MRDRIAEKGILEMSCKGIEQRRIEWKKDRAENNRIRRSRREYNRTENNQLQWNRIG